jgi:hypothetical protein
MPAPVLAAPLVIPFAEAIGVSIAALGMAKATDKVNEFIQENPEQSIKIFQMIMPSQGIANALKNKSSEGDEEVSEDIDVEVEEKPKLTGKEKSERIKAAIRRARAGKGNYSSPDAEGPAVDIGGSVIREVEDMGIADKDLKDNYDPTKPKFDYKKFFKKRYADGGSVGIEILFGPKRDNFRYGGDTMGGKNDKSKTSKGPDRSAVGPGSTYANNVANQNDGPSFKDKVKSVITNPAAQALGGAILTGGINLAIPGALDKLNKARVIKNAIDYARYVAPNEAIEGELENIQTQGGIVPYADGGRVGLFMGGSPLTGQALSIYNSMNAYGFDDQAIADALQEQGYYDPNASTPDPTPDPGQGAGQSGGRGSDQDAGYVDRQDYSFNKKNYRPGNQLEINPAAFGVSFPDQPSSPKREGIINQAIDSFTSLPTRSLSSFASPTTGGNIVGPAEQGFMGQTLDIDPAARTREEIRSLYDNYNRFKGRTSNFADARQKGKAGEVLGNILGFASGIPFLGKGIDMLSNAFGPQGDKSLQSKYTMDGAGFGNTGARDEFGLATFDKKDGFLGLTGNTTRDYTNRMNERLGELDDFFGERIDDFDINNINEATFNKMSKINGFYAKQVQAYKDRLEVERINREQKEKERMEASAANRAEANAITNRLANEYKAQQQRDGRDFSVSGPDTSANPTGKSNQASSERGYALHGAKGGSVPTGLATMFKEKR